MVQSTIDLLFRAAFEGDQSGSSLSGINFVSSQVAGSAQLGGLAFRFLVLGLVRCAKLFDLSFSFRLC